MHTWQRAGKEDDCAFARKHIKAVVNEIINLHAYFGVELNSPFVLRGPNNGMTTV